MRAAQPTPPTIHIATSDPDRLVTHLQGLGFVPWSVERLDDVVVLARFGITVDGHATLVFDISREVADATFQLVHKPLVGVLAGGFAHGLAAGLVQTAPRALTDEQLEAEATVTDDDIRALRAEARFAGEADVARLCSAALGLPIADGACGLIDVGVARERVVERIVSRRVRHQPPAAPTVDA